MDRRHPPKKQKTIRNPTYNQGSVLKEPSSVTTNKLGYPIFCLKYLVKGYTLDECSKDEKAHFASKIAYMAQKTWQILQFDDFKSGAGFEKMPRSEIKTTLPPVITDDVDNLLSIRFNNKNNRIIGHRSGDILHITHIDVKLTAYKH